MAGAGGAGRQTEAAAALYTIDTAASCPICHALFDTPLLLKSCGHSFCSTCIRQNLAFQERSGPPSCPTCRKPCDARDLLLNAALRDVLDSYAAGRPMLLAAAKAPLQAALQPGDDSNGCQQGQTARRQSGRKRTRQQEQRQLQADEDEDGNEVLPAQRRTRSAPGAKVDVDLAAYSSSGWSDGDASEPEASSGEEYEEGASRPSSLLHCRQPSGRRQVAPAAQQQPQQASQQAGGSADTPSGFVRCPVCSKAVPAFFINSHVDLCLVGGSQPSKAAGGSGDGGSRASIAAAATRAEKGPFEPLAVPPKLVPSLTTDKSLRQLLRKYGMNTDGKKKELLDRWSRLRLAVEMANDKQESTTYKQLAKRVAAQERQMAAVQLLQPASKAVGTASVAGAAIRATAAAVGAAEHCSAAAAPWASGQDAAAPGTLQVDADSASHPAAIILTGCSYRELIAVTRQRDALRKRVRQQAAAAAEEHMQQQQQADAQQESGAQQELPGLGTAEVARQQQAQQVEDEDGHARGKGLPMSQHQQPEREQQQSWQHHLATASASKQQQQEQHPPNNSAMKAAVMGVASGPCSRPLPAAGVVKGVLPA